MPSVSIIRSDKPKGPADINYLRRVKQRERTDFEANILKKYKKEYPVQGSLELKEKVNMEYCEKLGITIEQFIHKLEIFYGMVEDDEREWREQKYGKQD